MQQASAKETAKRKKKKKATQHVGNVGPSTPSPLPVSSVPPVPRDLASTALVADEENEKTGEKEDPAKEEIKARQREAKAKRNAARKARKEAEQELLAARAERGEQEQQRKPLLQGTPRRLFREDDDFEARRNSFNNKKKAYRYKDNSLVASGSGIRSKGEYAGYPTTILDQQISDSLNKEDSNRISFKYDKEKPAEASKPQVYGGRKAQLKLRKLHRAIEKGKPDVAGIQIHNTEDIARDVNRSDADRETINQARNYARKDREYHIQVPPRGPVNGAIPARFLDWDGKEDDTAIDSDSDSENDGGYSTDEDEERKPLRRREDEYAEVQRRRRADARRAPTSIARPPTDEPKSHASPAPQNNGSPPLRSPAPAAAPVVSGGRTLASTVLGPPPLPGNATQPRSVTPNRSGPPAVAPRSNAPRQQNPPAPVVAVPVNNNSGEWETVQNKRRGKKANK